MSKKAFGSSLILVLFLLVFASAPGLRLNAQDRNINKSTNDNNTSMTKQEEVFKPKAQDLSLELMKQVGFSMEKAENIRDILIGYNKDIIDAREKHKDDMEENDSEVGAARSTRIDGILGYDVGLYYMDSSPALMKEYRKADKEADEKITALLTDEQVGKYDDAKDQWWKKVKDEVFAPYHTGSKL
ncbi:MAG: hypothetical protein ACM34K_00545 [Bacillota bacterium]